VPAVFDRFLCFVIGHRYFVLERRAPEGPRHWLIGALARCERCGHVLDWRDLVGPERAAAPSAEPETMSADPQPQTNQPRSVEAVRSVRRAPRAARTARRPAKMRGL
jgi:hypothetical protein